MKLVIAAGGGGHFAPALSLIESMPRGWKAYVVGRKHAFEGDKAVSLEYKTAHELGIPFYTITTGRLQRKFTKHTIPSLLKIPVGFFQAMQLLTKLKPDVVISFGGYISLPVIAAAAVRRLPIIIHEQTLEAGLANKIAGYVAQKICISYPTSNDFFPKKKVVLTGNPLRKGKIISKLINEFSQKDKALPLIVITGGSGGSHAINVFIESMMEDLLQKYRVLHQTGDAFTYKDYGRLSAKRDLLPEPLQRRYVLTKFIHPQEFPSIIIQAHVFVSRSGIGTVTELLHHNKPAILIPLPHAQKDEQMKNALFLKKYGVAEVLPQDTLEKEKFLSTIETLLAKKPEIAHGKRIIPEDSVERIIAVIQSVYEQHKRKTH